VHNCALSCQLNLLGGQTCTDNIDIERSGVTQLFYNRLAIFPRLNFTCGGRIINIRATVRKNNGRHRFLNFQIWRPSSPGSKIYNRTGEAQLQSDDQVTLMTRGRREANISLTGDDRIEFQSGDVIGYFHPSGSRYQVRDVLTYGYVLYRFDGSPPPTSVNLSEANANLSYRQPLIQFAYGKHLKLNLILITII